MLKRGKSQEVVYFTGIFCGYLVDIACFTCVAEIFSQSSVLTHALKESTKPAEIRLAWQEKESLFIDQ